jgi:HAD superfamily phosphoserine phosphatase-like hydrolase
VNSFAWRLVTVDIDGTLTRGHGWRPIAEAFGRVPEYESSNRRFFSREIGEDEHLADLLAIATGQTVADVEAVVERTPKLRGIREGVEELQAHGARVALLSHNPSYVTRYYRRSFGFDDDEGVEAQELDDDRIGPPEEVRADKHRGLLRLLERANVEARYTVHVGDGWSDGEIFEEVGAGVALNTELPEVVAAATISLATDDFRDVARAIEDLHPRA